MDGYTIVSAMHGRSGCLDLLNRLCIGFYKLDSWEIISVILRDEKKYVRIIKDVLLDMCQ